MAHWMRKTFFKKLGFGSRLTGKHGRYSIPRPF